MWIPISKQFLSAVVLGLLMVACAHARTWTHRSGEGRLEADFADYNDGKVILRTGDGQTLAIKLEEFSPADRQFVLAEIKRRRAAEKAEVSQKPGTVLYGLGRKIATLENPLVDESSGLACSRSCPGIFWTHNDSGDYARIYAFDLGGRDRGSFVLADTQAFDWEDMASFSYKGKHYLLIADTGNNGLAATVHMLHLIEEPPVDRKQGVTQKQAAVVRTIYFAFEDDHRDCEALAVDPTDRTILLATKQREPESYVYVLPWPKDDSNKAASARKIGRLKIPRATAMDVSPDGRRAVVLTYRHAYEYTRGAGEDWRRAFSRLPAEIILPERMQGESICFGPDGKTLYLTSEKLPTPLLQVPPR